jgi:hypothetical protein
VVADSYDDTSGSSAGGPSFHPTCSYNIKMALHTIPTELRLTIAELLDARTCFKFALTSREDYHLYSSLLAKHKKRFARYKTLDTSREDAGRLVWDVTKEIIERPELAQYVEDVSLPDTRQSVWVANTYLPRLMDNLPLQVPEDVVKLYTEAARSIPIMKAAMETTSYDTNYHGFNWNIERTMRLGSDEPVAALLVVLATHLYTLRFTEFEGHSNYFLHVIKEVARASLDPIKAVSVPLQHLTYVAISYWDTELCCQAVWADVFISLPSLRGLAARKMGGLLDEWLDDDERVNMRKSKVKDILFQTSYFHPRTLEHILSGTESLRSFTYDDGGPDVSDEGCFASRRVTAALLKHAAHSLEHLTLHDVDGYDVSHILCLIES